MTHNGKMSEMPDLTLPGTKIECNLVIFDLSGTLVDTKPRFQGLARARAQTLWKIAGGEAVERWAEASGVVLGSWEFDEEGTLARSSRKEDLKVAAAALHASGYEWQEAKELAELAYAEADDLLNQTYEPDLFDGVEDALKRLRKTGLKLAVATNDRREVAEETLDDTGVRDLFQATVGADEVESPKPSPEMILLACERCGIPPSEAVCVGDHPNDMKAGGGAGAKALVAVSPRSKPSSELLELADIHVDSVSDFQRP